MPIAWWILNYKKYDPTFRSEDWGSVFRGNVLNVTNKDIMNFFNAIENDRVDINELKMSCQNRLSYQFRLFFFIDFDRKIYVNGFPDVEIEEYLPSREWKGIFDEPLNYTPSELKQFFS